MRYRVTWTIEVEADSPQEALVEAQDTASTTGLADDHDGLRVRQEPFDVPSPIWDVTDDGVFHRLR